ncbi:hypothetical protein POM88_018172 [Heracleum sosnowskyi]|uniref:GRF-type domain-containing protein n=1 Tax=Heracleum sosnowskyi TaxID=360622 RepID=A0AAD8IQ07_9APIA|nr:hypothetical protein POM88_018172 [Heracleum sosnowskyi]
MKSSASSNTSYTWTSQKSPIICKCGYECPMWTSQKPHSKGKRFFGCPFYKVREKYYGFFTWYDDVDRVSKTNEMTYKIAALEAKISELQALKKMEVGELEFKLKVKDAEISHLKWFKFGFIVILCALIMRFCL